jgi:hypothetical protein
VPLGTNRLCPRLIWRPLILSDGPWSGCRTKLDHSIASTGLFLAIAVGTVSAQPAGPAADCKIDPETPLRRRTVRQRFEQYAKIASDGDYTGQFWARRPDTLTLLKPKQPDYAAGLQVHQLFSMAGANERPAPANRACIFVSIGPQRFVAATSKPLDEMAWACFQSLRESKKVRKPDFHIEADLVKGTDDNYRSLSQSWPDSRYLVFSLSGEVEPNRPRSNPLA